MKVITIICALPQFIKAAMCSRFFAEHGSQSEPWEYLVWVWFFSLGNLSQHIWQGFGVLKTPIFQGFWLF